MQPRNFSLLVGDPRLPPPDASLGPGAVVAVVVELVVVTEEAVVLKNLEVVGVREGWLLDKVVVVKGQ